MPTDRLPKRAASLILEDVLASNWDPTNSHGWGLPGSGATSTITAGTSLSDITETHPSLVVTPENETVAGASGYSYLSQSGPLQDRDGSVVATIRVEHERTYDYNGSSISAERLAYLIRAEIERIGTDRSVTDNTDLYNLSAFPAGSVTDEREDVPATEVVSVALPYNWIKS